MRSKGLMVALAVAVTPARVQDVPVTVLSKPLAEFPEGFARLLGLIELLDGRVMTTEVCERVVKILDLRSGQAAQMGRTGAGPSEYRSAGRLYGMPGDSSVIYDSPNQRYLMIGPTGAPGRMFPPLPTVTIARNGSEVYLPFSPLHTDGQGRFYAREFDRRLDADGRAIRADSIAVMRWDPKSTRVDTLLFTPPNGPLGPIEIFPAPFTMGTQWSVAPDGRIALVHPGDYRVEYVLPGGARVAGRPIPFRPIRLSEAHKKEWREEQQPACPGQGAAVSTVMGTDGRPITARRITQPEPTNWPQVLPPIASGGTVFAPNGQLWVRRTTPSEDPWTYDVFDAQARLVGRVLLPPQTRFLGFGRSALYLTRKDDDDLIFVQRYPLPSVGRP